MMSYQRIQISILFSLIFFDNNLLNMLTPPTKINDSLSIKGRKGLEGYWPILTEVLLQLSLSYTFKEFLILLLCKK